MSFIDAARLQLLHLWEIIGAIYLAERTVISLGVGVFIAIVVVLTP